MVLLIILIVAAVVLVAWLLTRVGAWDFRLPRLREGSLEGASPSGSAVPTLRGAAGQGSSESDGEQRRGDQDNGHHQSRGEESSDYDKSDMERAVRERLYGRHGRRD